MQLFGSALDRDEPWVERCAGIAPRGARVAHVHLSRGQSDGDSGPRTERSLGHDVTLIDLERACLGRQIERVIGHRPARWPKPVAIEPRTDDLPVAEGKQGRSVPRLHRATPEPVVVGAGVGGRNHDREDVVDVPEAGAVLQRLDHLTEASRVADLRPRQQFISAKATGALAGVRPGAVALHRVDLPVVRDEPERLRFVPRAAGVGGEAAMKHPEAAEKARVGEVGIELIEVGTTAQRLVDDRGRRQRDEEQVGPCIGALELGTRELLGSVELLVERGVVSRGLGAGERGLEDDGARGAGGLPEHVEVAGHVSVALHAHAEEVERRLEHLQGALSSSAVGRHEQRRQRNRTRLVSQQRKRNVGHHPSAVAAASVRTHCAAVLDPPQRSKRGANDAVGALAIAGGHETNATRGVFGLAMHDVRSCAVGQGLARVGRS
jgi:hypothetical protein